MMPAGKALLRLSLLVVAAVALWLAYLQAGFVGFMADPIWYLDPARNFARGLGLVTRILVPAQIAFFQDGLKLPVLYLHHGPLAPLLLGLAYKALGMADWVPLAVGFSLTFLTGLVLYRLGSEVAGEAAALIAVFFFWTSLTILEANCSALTDPLFILLITVAMSCLWKSLDSPRASSWAAATGLALGIASCARLAGQLYWPGFAMAVFWFHRDSRSRALFLAMLLLPLVPLALYNHAAARVYFYSPGYYMLNWSNSFPGFRSSTTFMSLTSLQAVLAYPRDFLLKMVTGPAYAAGRFIENASNPYLMACVFFGMFTDFRSAAACARFQKAVWMIALPVVAFNAVISYGPVHYLDALWPAFAVVAAAFLMKFREDNRQAAFNRPLPSALLFVLLFLSPLALNIKDNLKSRAENQRRYDDQVRVGAFVKAQTRPDEVIYTDSNRMVVWQADRSAVALTATVEDARKTFRRLPPDALLLTSLRIDSEDYDQIWRDAFYRMTPVFGFVPCARSDAGAIRAVLFRRPRDCRVSAGKTPGKTRAGRKRAGPAP